MLNHCKIKLKVFIFLTFLSFTTYGQLRFEDKIRIREAQKINNELGDKIWKGIKDIPFTILLLTDSGEYLINHPNPSDDFKLLSFDTVLNTNIYYRESVFAKTFLASFPAVNGVNCIVIGTPENTKLSSTEWIIILLHEHFHIYEYTSENYYASVDSLNLSGGNKTGNWMISYPFPYDSSWIENKYTDFKASLLKAVSTINTKSFQENVNIYKRYRKQFQQLLKEPDYKYFSFQIWQEGIARYTEYKYLELITAANYQTDTETKQLKDFTDFKQYKDKFYNDEIKKLSENTLKEKNRLCFYSIGFAEGLLLDKLNPDWRSQFLTNKFYVEKYHKK